MESTQTPALRTPALSRNVLLAAGGIGLAGLGLAAGLMLRAPAAAPDAAATHSAQLAGPGGAAKAGKPGAPAVGRAAETAPLATQHASTCADCGVVEAVRAVQRKGEASGVGAVAGGVVGAVVGNQMGGGSGKKAMTVLGAIGGGLAGNEIEKRSKATTEYEVRVRMDDGSLRSFTSSTAPAPGAAVKVGDKGFRVVQREGEAAPRMVRTSS